MRVLLVDGSGIFRLGLRQVFAERWHLLPFGGVDEGPYVEDCATAARAREIAARVAPDLLVTDVELPDGSGLQLARDIRATSTAVRVLLTSTYACPELGREIRALGRAGCILKTESPEQLMAALEAISRGESSVTAGLLPGAGAYARPRPNGRRHPLEELSHRERQAFNLIVWGASNKDVARRMGISIKTVESHRRRINRKLHVTTASDCIRQASLWGLLPPGSPPDAGARLS